MKKLFSILILSIACVVICSAQNDTIKNAAGKAKDDWFISLGAGGNVLFNPEVNDVIASNGVGAHFSFSAGKWFVPYIGWRMQISSLMWQGAANADNIIAHGYDLAQLNPNSDGSSNYNVFFINPHVDIMLSLNSCFNKGYKNPQKWDIIPFAGIGYCHAFDYKGFVGGDCLTGNFGLIGKWCINEYWDLNVEVQTTIMPDCYVAVAGPIVQEDLSFSLGFTYNIGGRSFSYKPHNKKDKHTATREKDTIFIVNNTERVLERGVPVSNGQLKDAAKNGSFDQAFQIALIEFELGQSEPKQNYETQYYNVAAFLKAYPKVKLRLDAYCDKDTGTEEANSRLAQKRAERVREILVKDYGIDEDVITINAIGSKEQVYEESSLNRIVRVTIIPE